MKPKRGVTGQGLILLDWHRRLVYLGSLFVALTGLIWFISHDLLQSEPNDLQRWMLTLHGAGSFFASMIFGSMLSQHVRLGWNVKRNRLTGCH